MSAMHTMDKQMPRSFACCHSINAINLDEARVDWEFGEVVVARFITVAFEVYPITSNLCQPASLNR